jgi:glutaredoxin
VRLGSTPPSPPGTPRLRIALRPRTLGVDVQLRVFVLCSALLASACSDPRSDGTTPTKEQVLPELRITEDTPSLMLTWIDTRGGTHVEMKPSSVPAEARALVRVVVADREEGTRDPIYVVDLEKPEPDQSYLARSMPRRAWEEEIEQRRRAQLASREGPSTPRPGSSGQSPGGPLPPGPDLPDPFAPPKLKPEPSSTPLGDSVANVTVVVYGASWCEPCHHAMDHLKKLGVPVVFKDIEADGAAKAEMQSKLERIGRSAGSIPIIDVGGQILVGYSKGALDKALRKAAGGTML